MLFNHHPARPSDVTKDPGHQQTWYRQGNPSTRSTVHLSYDLHRQRQPQNTPPIQEQQKHKLADNHSISLTIYQPLLLHASLEKGSELETLLL